MKENGKDPTEFVQISGADQEFASELFRKAREKQEALQDLQRQMNDAVDTYRSNLARLAKIHNLKLAEWILKEDFSGFIPRSVEAEAELVAPSAEPPVADRAGGDYGKRSRKKRKART